MRAVALANQRRAERDARKALFEEEASHGAPLPDGARRAALESLAAEMEMVQAHQAYQIRARAELVSPQNSIARVCTSPHLSGPVTTR